MEIAEINSCTVLSRKLQHKLVRDAIRKTLKTEDDGSCLTSQVWTQDFHFPEVTYGTRGNGIVIPATQRQLSHQAQKQASKEHIRFFVFSKDYKADIASTLPHRPYVHLRKSKQEYPMLHSYDHGKLWQEAHQQAKQWGHLWGRAWPSIPASSPWWAGTTFFWLGKTLTEQTHNMETDLVCIEASCPCPKLSSSVWLMV